MKTTPNAPQRLSSTAPVTIHAYRNGHWSGASGWNPEGKGEHPNPVFSEIEDMNRHCGSAPVSVTAAGAAPMADRVELKPLHFWSLWHRTGSEWTLTMFQSDTLAGLRTDFDYMLAELEAEEILVVPPHEV